MKNSIVTTTAIASILAGQLAYATPAIDTNGDPISFNEETKVEDVVAGAGAGVWAAATIASWAAPTAVAHSSGMAILYSGAGYVAGTIGLGAATIAALPIIATVGAATATGAVIYKHREAIGAKWDEVTGDE